ncbi:iron-containing alcohol dehydrogenase [Mucilaginibacter sp. Bleaf8]|uniref:iron-containing alcohol dehydrogenase n=1 Tax=Mucilaginibacter sp. Bleaf8 TaxID=2834430 RepID=UPI001BD0348D|nr:iron-containing alcohol dehydrogenase [Mucilaginibacter sp. Bleaf8]MBS7564920.1 iron-containing alcohol dehydrogenase [Mucilaginibacter sp. Bleaf8]
MALAQHFKIIFPGKLIFGNGCLQNLTGEIQALQCQDVLIVTIEPLLAQLQSLIAQLEQASIRVSIDTSIVREPTFADFNALLQKLGSNNIDLVLGIGGGSVLDVAKLVAAQLDNTQTLAEIVGIGNLKQRNIKLICAPATAGTGSEVSPNAILVDDADNQKKGIISPFLVPDAVYVDPLLTMSVPPSMTAATGLDALTHCLEAYTNKFAQPFIDMYAYEGMRLIAANLVKAVKQGNDEEARTQVAMGSLLGGFCLGPVNTAAVHALAYPLGSMFHLAHGLSNALLLPHVMQFNMEAAPERYASVAIALGCERQIDDWDTALKGIEKIKQFMQECGVPARLRDVGIPEDAIPQMAEDAMKITRLLNNNPRPVTLDDAIAIFKAAY